MQDLHLRDARDTDRDSIRDVTISAYEDYADQWFWDIYRQNILETLAHTDPARQIVAERNGRIVGAVLLYPAGTLFDRLKGAMVQLEHPEVRLLAVAPPARGQGVGRALMQGCIRCAHQSGASAITLHTTDFMPTAVRLYERIGFVRAPDLDSEPAPNIIGKAYRRSTIDM